MRQGCVLSPLVFNDIILQSYTITQDYNYYTKNTIHKITDINTPENIQLHKNTTITQELENCTEGI